MNELEQSTQSQEQQSLIQVGLARFKPGSAKVVQHLISQSSVKHMLPKQNWRVKDKPFSQKWQTMFQLIDQALCERVFIESMECSSILMSIEGCQFPHLTVLNLSHNPIANVQSLTFLNAPNLQFIFLQTNHITSVKTLSKLYLTHLEQLDLSNNKIQSIPSISRLKMLKNTKGFSVELYTFDQSHHHHWHQDEHSCKIQVVNMMAKLEHQVDYERHDAKKKYEMLKRQFDYVLTEINSNIKFTSSLTQKKPLKVLQRKFCW